jgi:hypothetical protein
LTTQSKVADKVRFLSTYCKRYFVETVQIPPVLGVVFASRPRILKNGGGDLEKMTLFWPFGEVGLRI